MYLKVSSAKWRPFCLDLNVLIDFAAAVRPINLRSFDNVDMVRFCKYPANAINGPGFTCQSWAEAAYNAYIRNSHITDLQKQRPLLLLLDVQVPFINSKCELYSSLTCVTLCTYAISYYWARIITFWAESSLGYINESDTFTGPVHNYVLRNDQHASRGNR